MSVSKTCLSISKMYTFTSIKVTLLLSAINTRANAPVQFVDQLDSIMVE